MLTRKGRPSGPLRNIILWLVLLLLPAACVRDEATVDSGGQGDAVVSLTIRTPGTTAPRMTRSGAVDEHAIREVKIVVLEQKADGVYRYRYTADGQNIRPEDNNRTTFHALLKGSTVPVKLLLYANYGDAFDGYAPAAGDTEQTIRSGVVASFTPGSTAIPMYGEVTLERLDTQTANSISANMLRGWARADIKVDLDMSVSKNFSLSEAYIYRGRDRVQLAPDESALAASVSPRVLAPSVPAGADSLGKYPAVVYDPQSVVGIYLAECAAVAGEAAQLKGVSSIVVGGFYAEDDRESYYRIDFNSGAEGHPFGQVLRNHRYTFRIVKVTGRGWETPDEAANNRATFITAEIEQWNDLTTEMASDGDNYLGISSRILYFPYKKDSHKELFIQSTVPYSVCFVGDEANTISPGDAGTISNGYFRVGIVTEPGDNDDMTRLSVTTLRENQTRDNYESRLLIRYGNWKFEVTLVQYHFKEFANRSIRVLSVHSGSSGHLGSMTGYGDGSAMRRILSNGDNFSTGGTVDFFSGFDFSVVPGIEYFRYADGTNSYSHPVRTWLFAADVLYLANDNYISDYCTDLVMEWLAADPGRVLIIGGDGEWTSGAFLREDRGGFYSTHVDWWYNKSISTSYKVDRISGSGGFRSCPVTVDNAEFFTAGAFPTGSSTISFVMADDIFGYAKSYINDVIPLITHSNLAGSMVVGVDKGRRIVYHGDASLFQPTQMSSTARSNGVISTDVDRFWANLWAWIAYQVIWGERETVP